MPSLRIILGVTGASGSIYARRLLEELVRTRAEVHLVVSAAGALVAGHELKVRPDWSKPSEAATAILGRPARGVACHPPDRIDAPIASGSQPVDAMVIAPCSTSTLGAIANGVTLNLIHRAADVTLKERRPLILVVRETPLSLVHIENLRAAALAGATILPAMPSFYGHPRTVGDLVDSVVARVLDHLGVRHTAGRRFGGIPG
jgi:4-hydroxy-3-polyprenylbenzoate decarboxylase